ncbi:phospholipase D-like domain-containing protein [Pseudomonas sp. ANT_J28]|uniref:phospholipase D-like domain-containing protein n=1 Tax=Pseudomonas sp. ANT_J28 TaxID=2597352 RepID=UPI002114A73B|nr:phospholipase D-like domain-containing protein [Pseudomonas sp. ANT_J28]
MAGAPSAPVQLDGIHGLLSAERSKAILDRLKSTDSWLVFHAGRAYYRELLEAKVKLYERRDALLHVKTAVIDGVWSSVGSTNLDWRSFLHNDEVNVVVLGTGFGKKMQAAFMADLAKSNEIKLEKWQRRSLALRAKEQMGRLWESWL